MNPLVTEDGSIKKLRFRRIFFFVHDDELREAFDTYKKIADQATEGFIKSPFQQDQPAANIIVSNGGGKK